MRATEAGSHRASGHRIENVPLTEYQQFQSNMVLRPVPRYTLPRRMVVIGAGLVDSTGFSTRFCLAIKISLAMISQAK